MHEIKTLEDAEALCGQFCVPEPELDRRANAIATELVCREGGVCTCGSGCPNCGGDFWFHVVGSSEPEDYLCNLPPCPPGYCLHAAHERTNHRAALSFLKARNEYFKRAIAHFRGRHAPTVEAARPSFQSSGTG